MSFASFAEDYMLKLVNQARATNGLRALTMEWNLADAAEAHVDWMDRVDTVSHTGTQNTSPTDRIRQSDFDLSGSWHVGENLAAGPFGGSTTLYNKVEDLHEALMNSPTHRANILNSDFTHVGISIQTGTLDFSYADNAPALLITQNYGATSGQVDIDVLGTLQSDRETGGTGDDAIRTLGGNDYLNGAGGNDSLNAGFGNDTVYGGQGDDLVHGLDGADFLSGQSGSDRIVGGKGNDIIEGGDDNDRLFGGTEQDIIRGDNGNDTIYGQGGFDVIEGGAGNDFLSGGFNADTFVFRDGFGQDRIVDFEANNRFEKIDLSDVWQITSFSDLTAHHLRAEGSAAVIDTGDGDTIRLDAVGVSQLSADNFIF